MDKALRLLHSLDHEIRLLEHSVALVEWDQETYMPSAAIDERSEQIALLQGTLHEKIVSDGVARCLSDLGAGQEQQEGDPSLAEADRAFVREVFRQHSRHVKLPKKLVEEMARQASLTQAVWAKARADSDYASFAAAFTKLLDLVLQKAECIGYTQSKYDALLDEYEPYLKTDRLRSVFSSLQRDLKRLLDDIAGSGTVVGAEFLQRTFDIERQREFSRSLLGDLGYGFKDSRLDESAHPFTATLGDLDIRLTTRYVEDNLCAGIFGTIHEGGQEDPEICMKDSDKVTVGGGALSPFSGDFATDNIFYRDLPRIRRWLVDEGKLFHQKVRNYLAQFDKDISVEQGDMRSGARVTVTAVSLTSTPEEERA